MIAQSQQILEYMQKNGSITPLEALNLFGCMRLGARIYDLKAAGHQILTIMTFSDPENGRQKRFARYILNEQSS